MTEDAPNGRELRDRLIRAEGKIDELQRQWWGVVKWVAGLAAVVAGAIIVALIRTIG